MILKVWLLILSQAIYAQDGDLDSSFNSTGIVILNQGGWQSANDVAIQPDNKIVFIGSSSSSGTDRYYLGRIDSIGNLDNATEVAIGSEQNLGKAIAIQPDNKIIIAGASLQTPNSHDIGLMRFNSDFSIDVNFGTNGYQSTNLNGSEWPEAIGLQNDGKFIIAGTRIGSSSYEDIFIARYGIWGNLDNSFGTNGYIIKDVGNEDFAKDLLIQPDDKIVVAGYVHSGFQPIILRYNSDGTADSDFGSNGTVLLSGSCIIEAVALQEDGKIIVAGSETGSNLFSLYRVNSDGSMDTSFGSNGNITTNVGEGGSDVLTDIRIQANGKIIASGHSHTPFPTNYDISIVRYLANGEIDTTFGNNGISLIDIGSNNENDRCYASAIQNDGKLVLVGESNFGTETDFALLRIQVELNRVWHVATTGNNSNSGSSDDPFATIQYGINQTSNGDTVLVYPGTYAENINYNGKNIVVGSLYLTTSDTSYISSTIIDGNQAGSVVTFENGEDTTAVLSGFTIQNYNGVVNAN